MCTTVGHYTSCYYKAASALIKVCLEFSVFHIWSVLSALSISRRQLSCSVGGVSDVQQINDENCVSVESPLVSGGGPLSELSPSLLHEPDSGQPFLCGPQSSGEI